MIDKYIHEAISTAKYELFDDGSVYGEIPLCRGVYAKSFNFEECRQQLIEVLEEWILLRVKNNFEIVSINGISIKIPELSDAAY